MIYTVVYVLTPSKRRKKVVIAKSAGKAKLFCLRKERCVGLVDVVLCAPLPGLLVVENNIRVGFGSSKRLVE